LPRRGTLGLLAVAGLAAALACGSGTPRSEPPALTQTLYERLGEMTSLRRWVDELAWRLASDPELGAPLVAGDLAAVKTELLLLSCSVAGGPCRYDLSHVAAGALGRLELDRFLALGRAAALAVELPPKPARELLERLRGALVGPGSREGLRNRWRRLGEPTRFTVRRCPSSLPPR
jgi:truncated hemoglobin YjbI